MGSFFKNTKDISVFLWLALWLATLIHAGFALLAMFLNIQFPSGYQIPAPWVELLGKGPNSLSYWFYVIVLGANILWEVRFKGLKTYVPSSFPFPDLLYSDIAVSLWGGLWIFAHMGQWSDWFHVPNKVGLTFVTCIFLWGVEHGIIDERNNPEEVKEPEKNEPQPAKVEVSPSAVPVSSSKTNVAVTQPKTVTKRVAPINNELSQKVLDYIRENGQAKTGGLVDALGIHKSSIIRNLNKLIEEGQLVRKGNGPGAVYRLGDDPKDARLN
jgi:hypothetical protein